MSDDDSKFLAEMERIRQLPAQLDCAEEDRLLTMVKELDAEIARLRLDHADMETWGKENLRHAERLRKMVDVAKDKLTTLLNAAEVCVGVNDTGGLRASAVKENITQVLAELDRLERGG